MSLTHLVEQIREIVDRIRLSDPAINRVLISDNQGVEIVQYVKDYRLTEEEKESKNPIIPLLNSIMLNSEKFLGWLKRQDADHFIFNWVFDEQIVLAASSPFGFIGVFCEKDANAALIKAVLKEEAVKYNEIVRYIFN